MTIPTQPEVEALLDAMASAPDYAAYLTVWAKAEHALNILLRNPGVVEYPTRPLHDRFERIAETVGGELALKAMSSVRIYTPDECRTYQLARNNGASHAEARALLDAATGAFCDHLMRDYAHRTAAE